MALFKMFGAGQSNMDGRGTDPQTIAGTGGMIRMFNAAQPGATYTGDSGGAGSLFPAFATEFIARNPADDLDIFKHASGGTGLNNGDWKPGGATWDNCEANWQANGANPTPYGLWLQGEKDSKDAVPYATRLADMQDLSTRFATLTGGVMVPAMIGWASAASNLEIDAIRRADRELGQNGPNFSDIANAIHMSENRAASEIAKAGQRWWLRWAHLTFNDSETGIGPRLSSSSFSGTSITLTFDRDLDQTSPTLDVVGNTNGTANSGTPANDPTNSNIWLVHDGGSNVPITSATITGPRQIEIVTSMSLTSPRLTFGSGITHATPDATPYSLPRTPALTLPSGATTDLVADSIYDFEIGSTPPNSGPAPTSPIAALPGLTLL